VDLDDATLAEPSPLDTDEIPVVVAEARSRPAWKRTWALGGIAVAVAVFQVLCGLVLLFFYRPGVPTAHLDVVDLAEASRFAWVRELHHWGSHALVIVAALHLFRIVATGSYRAPRQVNFQVGVALGVVVLLSAATGYLLPWDERSQWLIRALSAAGAPPGGATLTALHALHSGALPVAGALLAVYHLRRARTDGAE
jgi:quinol-cytochrome oxidoreductase complex cytochrome b subunit